MMLPHSYCSERLIAGTADSSVTAAAAAAAPSSVCSHSALSNDRVVCIPPSTDQHWTATAAAAATVAPSMSAVSRTVRQRWSKLPIYCPARRSTVSTYPHTHYNDAPWHCLHISPLHHSLPVICRPFSYVPTPPRQPPPPAFPPQYFSGIQPTGVLHIGNYLGAIQPWLRIQQQLQSSSSPSSTTPNHHSPPTSTAIASANKLLISVVDLHAITVPQSPAMLQSTSLELATFLLACGLRPSHTTLFLQSHVAAHTELTWLLSCVTPHAWLNHMTQYKEKSKALLTAHSTPAVTSSSSSSSASSSSPFPTSTATASLGLYSYPLLMAADILLYRTTIVPVGNDQSQHLELTRNIAQRFNDTYTTPANSAAATASPSRPPYFPLPQTLTAATARVMSLRDPHKKMSKSDVLPSSRVTFSDTDDDVRAHIRRAVTDSVEGLSMESIERPERAGVRNLLGMLAACSGESVEALVESGRYDKKSVLKDATAEAVISVVRPVREEWARLRREQGWVQQVMKDGAREAEEKATQTLRDVKSLMGIVNRF